ncbi:MAG: tetratricopeptide repeat protein [Thermodesulfobacteriota bacterium]
MKSLFNRTIIFAFLLCLLGGCADKADTPLNDPLVSARDYLIARDYVSSISALTKIKKEAEKTKEYYLIAGLSHFRLGDFTSAAKSFEQAKPSSMEMRIYLAYLYLLSGNHKKAVRTANAIEVDFRNRSEVFLLKGNIDLKKGLYDSAELHYKSALKRDGGSVKALIGLANVALIRRKYLKAEEYYLKAVFLKPDGINAYIALSNYYRLTNRYIDAENNLRIAVAIDPQNINVLMSLINLYIQEKSFSKAEELIKTVLIRFPDALQLKILQIKTLFAMDKLDEASTLIGSLLEKQNKNVQYFGSVLEGELHLRKNMLSEALEDFTNLAALTPDSYSVNYYLGLTNLLKNNLLLSRDFLQQSINNYPGFTPSHLLLASVYMVNRKYSLASEHASFVLQLEPGNINAHIINGFALFLQGRTKEAEYEMDVVAKLAPDNEFTNLFNAITLINRGKRGEVELALVKIGYEKTERLFLDLMLLQEVTVNRAEKLEEVVRKVEEQPNYLSYLLLGSFFKERGALERGTTYLKRSIAMNDRCVIPHYHLAGIEATKGNIMEALDYLEAALVVDKRYLKTYQLLGILLERSGDYNNARKAYEDGLSLYPGDTLLLNNLAWIDLTHFDNKATAYMNIQRAVAGAPDDPDIRDTLGWWHHLSGNFEKAVSLFQDIVNLAPDNPVYRYHLGMAYMNAGKKKLAHDNLQQALELNISPEYRKKIEQVL